jgi:serine/threonine protein kinase/tetratricopeptide (TPR) repeat protein
MAVRLQASGPTGREPKASNGDPVEETFGRYRLLERLAQGSMAEVWKAKSFGVEGFEKILAVKRVLPELARSRRFSEAFVREAKHAVRLSHANIVQVFDFGAVVEDGSTSYFVAMEYVAGIDLGTLLARCREQRIDLPVGMCVYVASELAKGLDHAHRRRDEQLQPLGIVHGDVRPRNVLLSWEGEVKLADFGLGRARDALERDSALLAPSPAHCSYMSPEQARGQEIDARGDLFSLALVFYEALTGINPLRASTEKETLRRAQDCEIPPVEALRPDLPEGIGALLENGLCPAREERLGDAARLYERLVSCLYASGARFGANELSTFLAGFRTASAPPPSPVLPSIPPGVLEPDDARDEIPVYDEDDTPVELPAVVRPSSIRALDPASASVAAVWAAELGERRDVTALVFLLGLPGAKRARRRNRVREIVLRYGGQVIEDEADHLAALFGLVEPDGHDTSTAVRCAMVALRRAGTVDPDGTSVRPSTRHMSAGIHAARILVLPAGEARRDERLAGLLSTATDMARLRERACGISGSAARHVVSLFRFEPIEPHSGTPRSGGLVVKGPRTRVGGRGRFVGRKFELRRLGEILWMAARHRAHVITLRGPPGIGKTRMLYEAERRLRKEDYKVGFYLATCPPHGRAIAFSAVGAMLQVLCGIKEGDSRERALEVEPRLRALGLLDEEVAAVLYQLGASREGTTMAALRAGFARMIASLGADQLHVFAWDGAEALDEASYEVLSHAFARAAESRVVFILSLRDDAAPHPLETHPNHHGIPLGELDEAETRELITRRTGVDEAPPELVEFCRGRAKGHPLFVEELIKELLHSGALIVHDRRVVEFKSSAEMTIPRQLRALVAARTMRLSAEQKRALQAASVLGDPIELSTLALMVGEPMAKIERLASTLEELAIIRRMGAAEIAFVSPLIAEVVADSLPVEGQRQMHAAAALAIEAQLGERAFEQADRLATHLWKAGDRDGAAIHSARSAERKIAAGHYEGAAADALRALELCEPSKHDPGELVAWLGRLARAVYRARTARELPTLIGPVLAHIDRTGDPRARVAARIELASALVSTHEFDGADQCLQAAEALAEGQSPVLLRMAILTEAELARRRGDYVGALRRFEELALSPLDDPSVAHRVLTGLALSYAALGSPDQAKHALGRAEGLRLDGDVAPACERAKLRQVVALMSRDFAGAVRAGEAAVELAREAGLRYETAINLQLLGEALFRAGDLPRAYATFAQSAALCEEIAEERLLAHNRSFLAYLDSASDFDGALRTLEESIAYAHAHRYVRDEVNARYLLAKLESRQSQADARAEYDRCLRLARSVGLRLVAEDCVSALATSEESALA